MKILQIVPRLPPAIDGLGDYALNLARQLRQDFGVETHFLVGNPDWIGATETEGFPVIQLKQCSARTFLSQLPRKVRTILLHYVGYGYAKRGCPLWLVDGLRRWQSEHLQARLVTMFHEVYASGKFWTSAFWLSPLQRNLAARLAHLSDACLTSCQANAARLSQLGSSQSQPVSVLPVFSNVGEPETLPSLAARPRHLVVFGTFGRRLKIYQNALETLGQICHELAITKIIDIGRPTTLNISEVNGIPLIEMGERAASEISSLLLNSVAGLIDYPATLLSKSGIFATYCAYGLLPIVIGTAEPPPHFDGLEPRKHYWLPEYQSEPLDLSRGQAITNCAHAWYQTHNLAVHAQVFAKNLTTETPSLSLE